MKELLENAGAKFTYQDFRLVSSESVILVEKQNE